MNHTPAFDFPAEVGLYLPTPKGWKAELCADTSLLIGETTAMILGLWCTTVKMTTNEEIVERVTNRVVNFPEI